MRVTLRGCACDSRHRERSADQPAFPSLNSPPLYGGLGGRGPEQAASRSEGPPPSIPDPRPSICCTAKRICRSDAWRAPFVSFSDTCAEKSTYLVPMRVDSRNTVVVVGLQRLRRMTRKSSDGEGRRSSGRVFVSARSCGGSLPFRISQRSNTSSGRACHSRRMLTAFGHGRPEFQHEDSATLDPRRSAMLAVLLTVGIAWAAPLLSISPLGYRLVQVTPVPNQPKPTIDIVARAGILNRGDPALNVSATLTSSCRASRCSMGLFRSVTFLFRRSVRLRVATLLHCESSCRPRSIRRSPPRFIYLRCHCCRS